MTKKFSIDFEQDVIQAIKNGTNNREIARKMSCSEAYVRKVRKEKCLEPSGNMGGRPKKLSLREGRLLTRACENRKSKH